jgi:glycerophosphoryl diester phosphodiesterase
MTSLISTEIGNLSIVLAAVGGLLIVIVPAAAGRSADRPGALPLNTEIRLVGHRGAAGLAPENTLAGFKQAIALGVDAIELDVHLSADGVVVVHHDFTLKPEIARLPDGRWLDIWSQSVIREMTWEALQTYDVGRIDPMSRYARRYPRQTPVDGEKIPTLEQVIKLVRHRGSPGTEIWIEIKTSPEKKAASSRPEDVAHAVIALLRRTHFLQQAKILSFDWRALAVVQQAAPDVDTVYLSTTAIGSNTIQSGRSGPSPWTAGFNIDRFHGSIPLLVQAAGGRYWAPRYNQITQKQVQEAHNIGIQVFVWTPDTEMDLQRCIRMGVDGIITNRPDLLKSLLGRT